MNAVEALAAIRGYAAANRVTFSGHARERMAQRGAQVRDVLHALANATACRPSAGGVDRWRADGVDLDGDELTCVVVICDGLVVVTLF